MPFDNNNNIGNGYAFGTPDTISPVPSSRKEQAWSPIGGQTESGKSSPRKVTFGPNPPQVEYSYASVIDDKLSLASLQLKIRELKLNICMLTESYQATLEEIENYVNLFTYQREHKASTVMVDKNNKRMTRDPSQWQKLYLWSANEEDCKIMMDRADNIFNQRDFSLWLDICVPALNAIIWLVNQLIEFVAHEKLDYYAELTEAQQIWQEADIRTQLFHFFPSDVSKTSDDDVKCSPETSVTTLNASA